ncbi:MAG: M13 family metallopeptidase [Thermoanaerobaculia bacterium]
MPMRRSTALCCFVLASPFAIAAQDLTPDEIAGEVQAAMDVTADPCQDFYRYACGGWLDATELPADKSRYTRSFTVIYDRNRELVKQFLEEAAADPGADPDRQRIGRFYGSCMDEAAVEKAGVGPLAPLLARIASVEDAAGLLQVGGELQRLGVPALLGPAVFPDFQNPDLNIGWLFQGGLGLPDRDYYVSEDPQKRELLAAYEPHVARMLGWVGEDEATAAGHAAAIVAFETELAKASRPAEEMRDLERLYNKLDRTGLAQLTPQLAWDGFFAGLGHPQVTDLSVTVPEFFQTLERLATTTPPDTLQAYLRWHTVNALAPQLSAALVEADFDYFGRTLRGAKENEPRWKRCVNATSAAMGELVGKLYVERQFTGSSKQVALEMIGDIEAAFETGLPSLAWMDAETRAQAEAKVGTLVNKIGYPDRWRDYSGLTIVADDYLSNVAAATAFEFDYQTAKIGQPVDRSEWGMTPEQVNAYYNPLWNEIVFPAGILQPPFFHKDFPAAMNYGAVGGVIGHELTHGFDDQGRKFAPDGRLRDWWAPEAEAKFETQTQCVEDLYGHYEVAPGAPVNGQLTLGENIADIGGVKEAYAAYRAWEGRNGAPAPAVTGLTNDQLFFVAWSQAWCGLATDERLRLQVTTDPHSPDRFRAIGPLTQTPGFAAAFQCAAGTPMNPVERCEVW